VGWTRGAGGVKGVKGGGGVRRARTLMLLIRSTKAFETYVEGY
jgi:hypothetical protein